MMPLSPFRRWMLGLCLLGAIVAMVLLQTVAGSPRNKANPADMELTSGAVQFRDLARANWATLDGENKVKDYQALRLNLLLDSLLLVPSYVGLLILFTLALGPSPQHAWLRQCLCVPAVAAGLFDLAENSMTGQALDDLLHRSLVDATVWDITLASRLKWALLALALLILTWRAWPGLTGITRWLAMGAFGIGALSLWAGAGLISVPLLQTGLGFMSLGALVLSLGLYRMR
ncbi:MAG: hypothetical protein EKK47_06335 [Burkholderiales bacterium]|jgi:hypothetical protein|nr:MAG: hypothetical protein EKK47_06335 [Burkholderiales bacterium]